MEISHVRMPGERLTWWWAGADMRAFALGSEQAEDFRWLLGC